MRPYTDLVYLWILQLEVALLNKYFPRLVPAVSNGECAMDGILKALGFDSKPDYAEKIPETLTPDHFSVHNVS